MSTHSGRHKSTFGFYSKIQCVPILAFNNRMHCCVPCIWIFIRVYRGCSSCYCSEPLSRHRLYICGVNRTSLTHKMIRIKVRTRRSLRTLLTFLYRVRLHILHDIHQNREVSILRPNATATETKCVCVEPQLITFLRVSRPPFLWIWTNFNVEFFNLVKFSVALATPSDLKRLPHHTIEPSNSIQKHWRSANRSNFIYIIINNDAPPVTKRQHCIVCNAQNDKSTQTNTTKDNKSIDALRLRRIFLAFWRFRLVLQTFWSDFSLSSIELDFVRLQSLTLMRSSLIP